MVLTTAVGNAQISQTVTGYCKQDSTVTMLNPSLTQPSVTVFNCVQIGIPYLQGLVSLQLQTAGTPCEGLDAQLDVSAVSTPEGLSKWGITKLGGLNSPFPIGPCPPRAIINYGKHSGNQGAYSFSIGSLFFNGPLIEKHIESEMVWNDTLTITAPSAMTIAMPVGIVGSVFAAESFGTALTEGRAKLMVTGSVGSSSVNEMIEVVSTSVIPEQASIDLSRLLQVQLLPGPNTVSINLTARAEVTATAQGAGFIAGSATAGVMFPNSLTFGRFVAGDGSPLPSDILIVSDRDGAIYEDTTKNQRLVNMGFSLTGASGPPLLSVGGSLANGQTLSLDVTNAPAGSAGLMGVGYTPIYVPFAGGTIVPDIAAPGFVKTFAIDSLGKGTVTLQVPPNAPPGLQAYFQGWVLDPGAPNGLASATNAIQGTTPR